MDTIPCDNLDEAIDHYTTQLGFRLDMICPADAPREALLSKDGETIRLMSEPPPLGGGSEMGDDSTWAETYSPIANMPPVDADGSDWVIGRAGMEYRDLIPGRMGGKVIASHIRLTEGGVVPDYVHYHKVDFQMIYCKKGRIKVVYEDQGQPFWLETGDCVLQPPEIRHRVLECTAGAEVIEIGMPAVHETWVEHEITLPTPKLKPDRDFSGQRFVLHIEANAKWETSDLSDYTSRDTGISAATSGMAHVFVVRSPSMMDLPMAYESKKIFRFFFKLDDDEWLAVQIMKELDLPLRLCTFAALR